MVSRRAFIKILRTLLDEGIKFTLIGDTIISLTLGLDNLGNDIDLFVEAPSLFERESFYQELAERYSWTYGQTWLGTPKITALIDDEEVEVEFYDNLYDFYVPEAFIRASKKVNVNGLKIKAIALEEYIALKAYSGRENDMKKLSEISALIKNKRIKIDRGRLINDIREMEDQRTILGRLRTVGIGV
ncbi:MAG: nucleotidyltransferase [Caldisphaeraceae archaeon]|nr:nucleotidyltransferase [Caldisphaeraceae archaeon]